MKGNSVRSVPIGALEKRTTIRMTCVIPFIVKIITFFPSVATGRKNEYVKIFTKKPANRHFCLEIVKKLTKKGESRCKIKNDQNYQMILYKTHKNGGVSQILHRFPEQK